ncbi:MAG: GAF domain-containing protein [Nitrospirae bacterium]|nr:GAF domain-containing protein [Nitrospirota bacterium]
MKVNELDVQTDLSLLKSELARKELEIASLRDKLHEHRNQQTEIEDERRALLYMLEDLNESSSKITMAQKEWIGTFDSISDPIFIHDEDFRIIKANTEYQKISETPFGEIIGQPYYYIFPKLFGPQGICHKEHELSESEEELEVPSISKVFKVKSYLLKQNEREHKYFIHVIEDITELKGAYQTLKQETEINTHLLMIAEATAQLTDINKLMQRVLHCMFNILKNDISLSYLYDDEANCFRPLESYNLDKKAVSLFRTEAIDKNLEYVKWALKLKEAVIIPPPFDMTIKTKNKHHSRPQSKPIEVLTWIEKNSTLIFIPLISKDSILGLVICVFKNHREFSERDRKLLQGLSHQITTALEQARLYRSSMEKTIELSHKIEAIQIMHETDRTILSTLEPQDILDTTVRMIGRLIPCDRMTVVLVNKEQQIFEVAAAFGTSFAKKGFFVKFTDTITKEVLDTGRPQYNQNLLHIKSPLLLEKLLIEDGFLSDIRVPLTVKGEVTGIISLGSKRQAAFTPSDLKTLENLTSQIGIAMENSRLVSDLEDLFMGVVTALSSAIDAKSTWTSGHSKRVTKYAGDIAKEMGLSEKDLRDIELTGLLHDVGKIGTYEAILDKPGKINDEEIRIMRSHPSKGAEILSPIKFLYNVIPAIKHHHEYYNGTGYPDGLQGEDIPPLHARILAVADTVDAMGAERPYRKGRSIEVIVDELKRCSGTQFDQGVVAAFLRTLE